MPTVTKTGPSVLRFVMGLAQGKPVTPDGVLDWKLVPAGFIRTANLLNRGPLSADDARALKDGQKPTSMDLSYATVLTETKQIVPIVSPGKIDHLIAGTTPTNGLPIDSIDSRLAFVGIALDAEDNIIS